MKKKSIILLCLLAACIILALSMVNQYNKLVLADESVNSAWANVESNYQRRADLIPNLVSVVKGYAQHEQNTLTAVVDARAKATQITLSADNLTPETLKQYQQAQDQIGGALNRLLMVAESYPDIKANTNFQQLQAQLEGTENRIQIARENYNRTVSTFNQKIRKFPINIIANMFNFDKRIYFESDDNAEKAPQVSF